LFCQPEAKQKLIFRVMKVLEDLGLDQRKDLKVGSVLDKKISGGQRKRLNIAIGISCASPPFCF
jgi:ABC-type multidrug transport system ATPase subunit